MPSYKIIKSGHITEVYEYLGSFAHKKENDFLLSNKGGRHNEGNEERKMEYRETVNLKARQKIRRLINANFDQNSLFITLTYRENMQDLEKGSQDLKKFIQKMKRRYNEFKFVAVIEFQKRGAIHYHMLCNANITWKDPKELMEIEREFGEKIWSHGFVDIGYKQNDNAGAYLTKYMTKEGYDERLEGKKRYFFSRSLIQPQELKGEDLRNELIKMRQENELPVFSNQFYNEFTGEVTYREYNPKRRTSNYYNNPNNSDLRGL